MALKDLATRDDFERLATRVAAENRAAIAESRTVQMAWTVGTVLALACVVVASAHLTR